MRRSDFSYELPPELIAQYPPAARSGGRLLCLDGASGRCEDRRVVDLPSLLKAGDLLVFNDTRVIPARLRGRKRSGGAVEVLIERIVDEHRVLAQLRANRPLRAGCAIDFPGGVCAAAEGRCGEFHRLRFDDARPAAQIVEEIGHLPLPPYIARRAEPLDRERYQTVFARAAGAVAAPTAGLHFDAALLARAAAAGVTSAYVTLHVGAGTFQPLRVERLREHKMHRERIAVGAEACAQVRRARARGGRVVAVGTTVVRALEAASQGGALAPVAGETDLFVTPGYRFRTVDVLLTNFHMPESTLLMLVCAFGGRDHVLAAYRHAVAQRYRFYSYGDAMFVTKSDK